MLYYIFKVVCRFTRVGPSIVNRAWIHLCCNQETTKWVHNPTSDLIILYVNLNSAYKLYKMDFVPTRSNAQNFILEKSKQRCTLPLLIDKCKVSEDMSPEKNTQNNDSMQQREVALIFPHHFIVAWIIRIFDMNPVLLIKLSM